MYDQTGDIKWVKLQQQSCERALDWIIKRDSDNDGLVEMMTDNHTQKEAVTGSISSGLRTKMLFVNAKLYHALILWADIERQLGNAAKKNITCSLQKS